jgi:hypothetical protein
MRIPCDFPLPLAGLTLKRYSGALPFWLGSPGVIVKVTVVGSAPGTRLRLGGSKVTVAPSGAS